MPTHHQTPPRRQRWADPTYCPERPRVPTMERPESKGISEMTTSGQRVYDWDGQSLLAPGEFAVFEGKWYASSPNGLLANLSNHEVGENAGGTITVTPSILVRGHDREWHGYLTDGEWREC